MPSDDPVRLLERLASRIVERRPQRPTPQEVWAFIGAMVRVQQEAPQWIDGLPEGDRELFFSALAAPLRVFQDVRIH